jgi:hypothetical protein
VIQLAWAANSRWLGSATLGWRCISTVQLSRHGARRWDDADLTEAEVAKLLTWERLIPAMEEALAAFSAGHVIQPLRNMITIEEGKRYLGVMPAVTDSEMGAKLVSFYPETAGGSVSTSQ